MRIAVFGLWHLGSVISACLAKQGIDVIGVDPDPKTVARLSAGHAPLFEPGLDALLTEGLAAHKLRFTTHLKEALQNIDLVWMAFDTPVNNNDEADIAFLNKQLRHLFAALKPNTPLLVSSQAPVGFSQSAERLYKKLHPKEELILCYSPENLRLGQAIASFQNPVRIVAGTRRSDQRSAFTPLLSSLSASVEWMTLESAEMVKHAINSFLAASIAWTNEVATLCEATGANASEVERGLRTEPRIGPKAYVKAGAAFAGGTLARDVQFLIALGKKTRFPAHVLNAVLKSNAFHKEWAKRQIQKRLRTIKGKRIAFLGLSYKAGTDTPRRSWAIELAQWLSARGATIQAYDSSIHRLPPSAKRARFTLMETPAAALEGAHAVVIGTNDPAFRALDAGLWKTLKGPLILDADGLIKESVERIETPLTYIRVGHSS
jgi:UDPglucose 6-dehydrogenase